MNLITKLFKNKLVVGTIIVFILGAGYYVYHKLGAKDATLEYRTAAVEKGTLTISVGSSGQVAGSGQVDVKSKASGDVVAVLAAEGQEVKAGTVLVRLDSLSAQKAVRDAVANLESAQLSLQKLHQAADGLSLLQAENTLTSAETAKTKDESDLKKTYEDGFNTVANAFLDLPGVLTGLHDILYTSSLNGNQNNVYYFADAVRQYDRNVDKYRDSADASYQSAKRSYDQSFLNYKASDRYADAGPLQNLIDQTYNTALATADAVKNLDNYLDFYQDRIAEWNQRSPALVATYQSSMQTYTGQMNSHVSALSNVKNGLQTSVVAISADERAIAEKTVALEKLKGGSDPLDLRGQELAVQQRQNALSDAREKLADYYIRAPFDGVVAKLSVKKGDSATSGAAVATMVTRQQIAEISLNEIDIAKVKTGQKATLTFDAVPDLSITGTVEQVDTIGTATQGVVNYSLKISFDTQDARIKPGMSVAASVITDVLTDVFLVPQSAMKMQGQQSYVEVLENGTPRMIQVQAGLSNDTMIEVAGDIEAGAQVIVQTITPGAAAVAGSSTEQQRSGGFLPIGGFGGR